MLAGVVQMFSLIIYYFAWLWHHVSHIYPSLIRLPTTVHHLQWELVKKLKWEAWSDLGGMSREEAMQRYIDLLL